MTSNRLILLAIGGILVAAICFGAAVGIGGRSALSHIGDLGDFDLGDWDSPRCGVTLAGHDDTRTIDWSGADEVQIEIPATVHYKRGEGDKLVVTGDAALVPMVRLDERGRIRFNCRLRHAGDLTLTLPGRDFRSYSVKGSGDVTLEGIDQPTLEIDVAGRSNLTATGKADKLEYNLAGAGDAKMGGLQVERAELNIAGHGDTEINASDSVEVNIAGHGDVKLVTEPHHLEKNIFGAGEIVHPDGEVESTHGMGSSSHGERHPRDPESPRPPEAPKQPI